MAFRFAQQWITDFALDVESYFEYVGVRYGQFCFNFEISYGDIELFSRVPLQFFCGLKHRIVSLSYSGL